MPRELRCRRSHRCRPRSRRRSGRRGDQSLPGPDAQRLKKTSCPLQAGLGTSVIVGCALQFSACGGQPLRYIRRVVGVLRSFDLVEEGSVYEGIKERSDGRKQLSGSGRLAPGNGFRPRVHPLLAHTLLALSRAFQHRRHIEQWVSDETIAPVHQHQRAGFPAEVPGVKVTVNESRGQATSIDFGQSIGQAGNQDVKGASLLQPDLGAATSHEVSKSGPQFVCSPVGEAKREELRQAAHPLCLQLDQKRHHLEHQIEGSIEAIVTRNVSKERPSWLCPQNLRNERWTDGADDSTLVGEERGYGFEPGVSLSGGEAPDAREVPRLDLLARSRPASAQ